MPTRGELQIDPADLAGDTFAGEIELVVPYTDPETTRIVLNRAIGLTAGLNARIFLVAVHAVPYPSPFVCPTAVHAFLVEQLLDLAQGCSVPVAMQVVLARTREDGFRHALRPEATVLVGTHRHFWRTSEERLARMLVDDGHKVVLLHVN
jgi:hypothetical protein